MGNKCFGSNKKSLFQNVLFFQNREENDLNLNIFEIRDSYLLSLLYQLSNQIRKGNSLYYITRKKIRWKIKQLYHQIQTR